MNDCSGNGACLNGFCNCKDGFTGADCSAILNDLSDTASGTISGVGVKWTYFVLSDVLGNRENWSLTFASDQANMDIYLSSDATV